MTGGPSRTTVDERKSHKFNEQSYPRAKKQVASEVEGLAQVSKQSQLVEILVKIFRARPLTRLLCSVTHLSLLCSLTLLLLKCMRA